MTEITDLDRLIIKVREDYDANIVTYIGDVYPPNDRYMSPWLAAIEPKRKNILLLLRTNGGYPDTAYRIARQFQIQYQTLQKDQSASKRDFLIYIGRECKSAGTLLALGADRIIMSDAAEFGPLDVQLRKPDEVGERTSGLAPMQALGSLREQATEHFKEIFQSLRFDQEMMFSTKVAAEIATNITIGLLNSIYAQIDPIRMSEIERQLNIASAYGERLSKSGNLKPGSLSRLLAQYPSHGFVIDKEEASELFNKVESPTPELSQLFDIFCSFTEDNFSGKQPPYAVHIQTLEEQKRVQEQANVQGDNARDSQNPTGAGQKNGANSQDGGK